MQRLACLLLMLLLSVPAAPAASNNGVLSYRGFTVDMSLVATAPNRAAIETSLRKQPVYYAWLGELFGVRK